uniref:Uncharacterized protein n=1 Tax=uncultured Verrucomicrobiales bacterium HF0200_39L05 TaxID=710997 RepID=E0XUP1_9BACT|nr:hypothetical protein [uncultured Verrucomicrobiales bacterium HF0200_39L05]
MVRLDSCRVSRVPHYSGYPRYDSVTLTGLSPSLVQFSVLISFPTRDHIGSHNPGRVNPPGLGCSAFARHYLRNLFDFFSSAY